MYIDHSRSMYLVNPSYTLVVESHARPIPRCSYLSIGERTGSQRCEVPRWHVVAGRQKWATPKKLVILAVYPLVN